MHFGTDAYASLSALDESLSLLALAALDIRCSFLISGQSLKRCRPISETRTDTNFSDPSALEPHSTYRFSARDFA
jgi:hypothetical protein